MKFHFIAIGGAVMHNLALELHHHGHQISGSDDEIFDPAKTRLSNAGLLPEKFGWFPDKISSELDAVVLGMHARADNPELIRAKELNLPVYSFPGFIYEQSKDKKRVVIAGSHGKTTCTAMLIHVLTNAGMDIDYLVGSQLPGFERMVRLSDAPVIIIEGDEYLTSALDPVPKFHIYKPHLAMITGIAWDHVNVFPTFDIYKQQFSLFERSMMPDAGLFWFGEDADLSEMSKTFSVQHESYGTPDYISTDNGTTVRYDGKEYELSLFGRHNLQNAEGVRKLAEQLGISGHDFWFHMQSFQGTAKRLEKVYDAGNMVIFRDFAHAPSKVKASVSAVREQFPGHRFIAVFELHTYSSLQADFLPGYKDTLNPADAAFVLYDPHVFKLKKMPLPPAGNIEKTIGHCIEFSNPADLLEAVKEEISTEAPTVLLLMSSGNLGGLQPEQFLK